MVNDPKWSDLKNIHKDVEKSGLVFGNGMATVVRRASESITRFGHIMYKVRENEYLKCHKKLPGGDSDLRLKKKRLTMATHWHYDNS